MKKLLIIGLVLSMVLLAGCQDKDKNYCDNYNPDKETYEFVRYAEMIKDYHHYDESGNYVDSCEFKDGIPQENCEIRYYDACIFCPKDKIENEYFCGKYEIEVEVTNYAQTEEKENLKKVEEYDLEIYDDDYNKNITWHYSTERELNIVFNYGIDVDEYIAEWGYVIIQWIDRESEFYHYYFKEMVVNFEDEQLIYLKRENDEHYDYSYFLSKENNYNDYAFFEIEKLGKEHIKINIIESPEDKFEGEIKITVIGTDTRGVIPIIPKIIDEIIITQTEKGCVSKAEPLEIDIILPTGEVGDLWDYIYDLGYSWNELSKNYCEVANLNTREAQPIESAPGMKLYGTMPENCETSYQECIPEYERGTIKRIVCRNKIDTSGCDYSDKTYTIKFY